MTSSLRQNHKINSSSRVSRTCVLNVRLPSEREHGCLNGFGPGRFPSEQTHLFKHLLGPLEGLLGLELERGADQKLGFTYIKDTALGCYLLYRAKDIQQKTVNIVTDEVISLPQMVKLAQKYADTPTEVKIGPGKYLLRGETLDISVAKKELGFYPRYNIDEGMKEYAAWLKKNKK